ncbi:MAG: hypothetical protein WA151_02225 [Desulfatirhabdiaceae bacterium]
MTHGPVTRFEKAWALGLIQIRVGNSLDNIAQVDPVLPASASVGALASTKFLASAEFYKKRSGFPLTEDGSIPLSDAAAIGGAFREITPYTMALARGLDPTAAMAATASYVCKKTTAGTTDATKVIDVSGTPVTDEYTVAFTGAAAGNIYSRKHGLVHTFSALTAMAQTDGYFTIPASFFTGTWASGDVYVFRTTKAATAGAAYPGDPDDWAANTPSIGFGGLISPADLRIEGVYIYPDGLKQMVFVFPRGQISAAIDVDFAEQDPAAIPVQFESKTASSQNSAGNAVWDSMPLGSVTWGVGIAAA